MLLFAFCDGDLTPAQLFSEKFSVQNFSESFVDQTASKFLLNLATEAGFNVVQLSESEEIKTILSNSYKHTKSLKLFPRIFQLKTKVIYNNISVSPHNKHTSFISSSTFKVSNESTVSKIHTDPKKFTGNIIATSSFNPSIFQFPSILDKFTQNKSVTLENNSFSETPLLSHSPIYSSHPNYITSDKRLVNRATLFSDKSNSIKKKPLHNTDSALENVSSYKIIPSRNFVSVTNVSTEYLSTDRVFLSLVSSYLMHEPYMSAIEKYSPYISAIEKYSPYMSTIEKYSPYMSTIEKYSSHMSTIEKYSSHMSTIEKYSSHMSTIEKYSSYMFAIEKYMKSVLTDSSDVLYKCQTISAMEKSAKITLKNLTTISSTVSLLENDKLSAAESQVTSTFKLPYLKVKSTMFAPEILIITSSVLKVLKKSVGVLPADVFLVSTTKRQTQFPLFLQSKSNSISHESMQVSLEAPHNAKKLMKIVIFVQEFHPKYSG